MKILIVEDEILLALGMMECLEAAGHRTVGPAPDAASALHFAGESRPDLALIDLTLRHGDKGYDVACKLLQCFGVNSLYVTAQCDTAREKRDGALGCVSKPVAPDSLIASIEVARKLLGGEQPARVPMGLEVY